MSHDGTDGDVDGRVGVVRVELLLNLYRIEATEQV